MRTGLLPLVNPPTPVNEVDIEATREARENARKTWLLRQKLIETLQSQDQPD